MEKTNEELDKNYSGKPSQIVSYEEKIKDDFAWAKATMKYYLDGSDFGNLAPNMSLPDFKDKRSLYNAYNNRIPSTLFDYVTDPLKAKNEKFKGLPAKIREQNILRPNIDLFIGEWNKRPFYYDVVNVDGDDAVNSFMMHKDKMFKDNVTQRYVNTVNKLKQENGEEPSDVATEEIPDPRAVASSLNVNYKDAKALKGYRGLKVLELELKLRETWKKLFKDWLIAGEVFTLKLPMHGDIVYIRLSPLQVAFGKSELVTNTEDGIWASAKFRIASSEFVHFFYDKLSKEELKKIELNPGQGYSNKVFTFLGSPKTPIKKEDSSELMDLYYVCWKAQKIVGFLKYPDPLTGEEQYDVVDESYKVDKEAGEEIEWQVVNEVWHGWREGQDNYFGIEAIPAQRNEMNNFAACKLPINGKRFSDTESDNISLLWLGLPYQIIYMILNYRMELTIAKSKGKVFLLDKSIVDDEDEAEETFWYSEAMGYMLVDFKKVPPGVNQFAVHDMSLFKDIKELIGIMQHVKDEWDELIGVNRQRKGQNVGSDGKSVNEQSIFRSTVISDLVFTGFEEFLESELQGLHDNSKFAWVDGKKGYYRNDDDKLEMLAIEPDDYSSTQLGIFVQNMSSYLDKFNRVREQVNALAQRKDTKISTIIDLSTSESLTELKALVKKAEFVEQQMIQKTAENEADRAMQLQESQQRWELFKHGLELDKQEKNWDREDNNTLIKGEIQVRAAKDPSNLNPDLSEVEKQANERLKTLNEISSKRVDQKLEQSWQDLERERMKLDERNNIRDNKTKLKNKTSGEK